MAHEITKGNHMFLVSTHTDRKNIHNHITFCAVNLDEDRKFKDPYYSYKTHIRTLSDKLCHENGLSVIERKGYGVSHDQVISNDKLSYREILMQFIDKTITQSHPNPKVG